MDFYKADTVQKIILSQWSVSIVYWKWLFRMYIFLFMIPFCASIVVEDPSVSRLLLRICIFPIGLLLLIELIQIKIQKFGYFKDWNITDLLHIVFFLVYVFQERLNDQATTAIETEYDNFTAYLPELKLFILFLSMIRMMSLIRIYEDFGFLVQMIIECVKELIPFLTVFILILILFTLSQIVINMNPHADSLVAGAQGLTFSEKMFLGTFLISVGNLTRISYEPLLLKGYSPFAKWLNVQAANFFWFFECFVLLVLALNFLISVIFNTYMLVKPSQALIILKSKAELNMECFQLLRLIHETFSNKEKHFKVCTFTNATEKAAALDNDQYLETIDRIKKTVTTGKNKLIQSQKQVDFYLKRLINIQGKIEKNIELLDKVNCIQNENNKYVANLFNELGNPGSE